jgi:CRP/FNR family transcriptional regulator, cyclic AMP receptor protein
MGKIDLGQAVDDVEAQRSDHPWPAGSLLTRLQPAARDALLAQCRTRRFAPTDVLLRQGATDRHAYVLLDGEVTVRVIDSSGVDAVLAVRRRGDIVGELAALTGEPRTATVIAATAVLAGTITASAFMNVLTTHPQAAWEVVRTQAHRLEWANRRGATALAAPVLADHSQGIDTVDRPLIRTEST